MRVVHTLLAIICTRAGNADSRFFETHYKARTFAILYAPREYYKRYASTLWAARMRYANTLREYALGCANTIHDTRYANTLCLMLTFCRAAETVLLVVVLLKQAHVESYHCVL